MVLYFGAVAAIAGIIHVIFGAFYFGASLFTEFVVLPRMKQAKNNAELVVFQGLVRRFGPLIGMLGFGALLTGILFLLAKFGTDFGVILALPESRTIVIALFLFIALVFIATALLQPTAKWFLAQDFATSPSGEVSAEVKARFETLSKVVSLQTVGVFAVIILMGLAVNGGI